MSQPKVILFDLYETLITEFTPEWSQIPSLSRLNLEPEAFMKAWRSLSTRRLTGDIPNFPDVLHEIYHMLGQTADEEAIEYLYQERLALKARPLEQLTPPILTMLKNLQEIPLTLGLLSNASSEEIASWQRCELAPYFTDVTFSCDVGLQKPDPHIYHLACERLQVSVDEVLFVGDGGSDELTGAAAVGLAPYWATWFLDAWPDWKRSTELRKAAAKFPRLRSPEAFVEMVRQKIA